MRSLIKTRLRQTPLGSPAHRLPRSPLLCFSLQGTNDEMRLAASVFGPSRLARGKHLEEVPAFVAVARAMAGKSMFGDADGHDRGLPRGAAAAALGSLDADQVDAEGDAEEALLSQSGRPISGTMLYMSQVLLCDPQIPCPPYHFALTG
jgi:hypothetical protein